MSGGRVAWIIWCLAWVVFWVVMFFVVGRLSASWAVTTTLLVAGSVAAAWLPVGEQRVEACPICGGRFPQRNMTLHVQVRHPGRLR